MSRYELKFENHFDGYKFAAYMINKAAGDPETEYNETGKDYLNNLINYAISHKQVTKDSLPYFLFDTVPNCEFEEAAAFCEDCILTDAAREIKARFWEQYEAKEHARQLEIIQDYRDREQAKKKSGRS